MIHSKLRTSAFAIFSILLLGACEKDEDLNQDDTETKTYSGDIILSTQAEVDAFTTHEYEIIYGDLIIGGSASSDVSNLSDLNTITTIYGNLDISFAEELVSLSGLDKVTVVSNLQIYHCTSLLSFDALSNLIDIRGGLFIQGNDELQNIDGLASVSKINGDISIRANSRLKNLDGLLNVSNTEPMMAISILENDSLLNLDGLQNIHSFLNSRLSVERNNQLTQISGLYNLTGASDIRISENPKLIDINGFNSLIGDVYHIDVTDNESLQTIRGFNLVDKVTVLSISNNIALETIDMLPIVPSFKTVAIRENTTLNKISGFGETYNVGYFEISNCPNLPSLDSFESLSRIVLLKLIDNEIFDEFCVFKSAAENVDVEMDVEVSGNASNPTLEEIELLDCTN